MPVNSPLVCRLPVLDFIILKIKLQITNCFKLKIHPQINEKERENNNNYLEKNKQINKQISKNKRTCDTPLFLYQRNWLFQIGSFSLLLL